MRKEFSSCLLYTSSIPIPPGRLTSELFVFLSILQLCKDRKNRPAAVFSILYCLSAVQPGHRADVLRKLLAALAFFQAPLPVLPQSGGGIDTCLGTQAEPVLNRYYSSVGNAGKRRPYHGFRHVLAPFYIQILLSLIHILNSNGKF